MDYDGNFIKLVRIRDFKNLEKHRNVAHDDTKLSRL